MLNQKQEDEYSYDNDKFEVEMKRPGPEKYVRR
jgi:hypothetical protein